MSQMIYLADDEKNIRDLMEAALTEEGKRCWMYAGKKCRIW